MDEGVIIVLDYDKICRLCLQTRGVLYNIFDIQDDNFNNAVPLIHQIKLLTSIDVVNSDAYPRQICHKCLYEVEMGYQLRQTVIKSNQLLTEANQMNIEKLSQVLEDGDLSHHYDADDVVDNSMQGEDVSERFYMRKRSKYEIEEMGEDSGLPLERNNTPRLTDESNEKSTISKIERVADSDGDKCIRRKKSDATPLLVCQLCLSRFSSMEDHSSHIFSHYSNFPDLEPYHIAQKPFMCHVCEEHRGFSFRNELIIHHREHLNMNPYRCPEKNCKSSFKSKDTLRQHSYTHAEKKFICEMCGAAFRRRSELSQHYVRHQDEGVAYQCNMCHVVCKNRISYKAHIKHHEQGKRFKCLRNGCSKAFFSKSDLDVHERSHTNDKRFKCSLCVCAYISQSQLNRHLKQHERRKVTKCDKCTLSFNDYAEFCNHRISTHGEWLPHRCKYCKQGYQNVRALERHLNRCKLRGGSRRTDPETVMFNTEHADIREMGVAIKAEPDLNLDDNTLQNTEEASFLYITDIDSQDVGPDSHHKNELESQDAGHHFMIIHKVQDVDNLQDQCDQDNDLGNNESHMATMQSGEHYMLIKDDGGDIRDTNFACKVFM